MGEVARLARPYPGRGSLVVPVVTEANGSELARPNRDPKREDAMSTLTDAMRGFLDERRYAVLATHNDDGSIHLTPVWYLFERGAFFVESLSTDRKARNVASRPAATIVVDVRRLGAERWVYAAGAADVIAGEESREINARIGRRYLTDEAIETPNVGSVFAAAVDVTICLTPTTWRAWDLRDMDEQYFGSSLGRSPERWFLPVAD
jgi:PPOX class probable F420-dependent enzyme